MTGNEPARKRKRLTHRQTGSSAPGCGPRGGTGGRGGAAPWDKKSGNKVRKGAEFWHSHAPPAILKEASGEKSKKKLPAGANIVANEKNPKGDG